MNKQREELPAYHLNLLKEKMQQLANMEAELKVRDEMSKAEADRRLHMIETQRKEAVDEISRYRERTERGLSEER